jgi:hypothetical protein
MEIRTHIRLWVGMFVVCLLISPLLRKGQSMVEFARHEVTATQDAFGPVFGMWILGSVNNLYKNSPAAVVVKTANIATTSKEQEDRLGKKLGVGVKGMIVMANSYFTGLVIAAYVACLRLLVVACWFGMLAPVLVAAILDGFAQRAIKQHEFGSIRPAAFSILAMIVIPFCFAPLLYLTIPVSVSPSIVPTWVFLGCVPLSMLIANTQPVFGKH